VINGSQASCALFLFLLQVTCFADCNPQELLKLLGKPKTPLPQRLLKREANGTEIFLYKNSILKVLDYQNALNDLLGLKIIERSGAFGTQQVQLIENVFLDAKAGRGVIQLKKLEGPSLMTAIQDVTVSIEAKNEYRRVYYSELKKFENFIVHKLSKRGQQAPPSANFFRGQTDQALLGQPSIYPVSIMKSDLERAYPDLKTYTSQLQAPHVAIMIKSDNIIVTPTGVPVLFDPF